MKEWITRGDRNMEWTNNMDQKIVLQSTGRTDYYVYDNEMRYYA